MDSIKLDLIKIIQKYNSTTLDESFIKDFAFMKCKSKDEILKKIWEIMNINNKIILYRKNIRINGLIIPPYENKIFLYKMKNKEGFLAIISKYKKHK